MIVGLQRKQNAPSRNPFENSTPYDLQFGFWGVVTEVHPEDCTVHVRMSNGMELSGVRVASVQWVTVQDGKHLTGERDLPPIDTYVFCVMPNGEYSSAFVLCSGYARHEAVHADFKGEGEDFEKVKEKVENSGWHFTTDNRTGTKKAENKTDSDPTITLLIDQENEGEESVKLMVHGNTITVSKDGINIESDKDIGLKIEGDTKLEVKGNAEVKTEGDTAISGNNVTVKSSVKTEIKGGQVVLGGTVTPTGKGALCGIPACPFTGAPHTGDTSVNA